MAEKHKSKYKKPENAKPTRRKDIKDYMHDDKAGALNPYSTGKKQERVARKTDKAVQDDGKMFPKYTDKDRLYKKIEDGEYDPKHAMNVLRKRQETDTDDYFDAREKIDHGVTTSELDERISKLSSKQKEQLVREYLRRKIVKVLREQPEPADKPEEEPADAGAPPAPDAGAPPAPDAGAPAPDAGAPAPAPAPPTPAPPAPAPAAGAGPAAEPAADKEKSPEEKEAEKIVTVKKWLEYLKTKQEKGPTTLIQTAVAPLAAMIKKLSPEDAARAKKLAIRQIRNISIEPVSDEEDSENSES
jgi:hypothetical protein